MIDYAKIFCIYYLLFIIIELKSLYIKDSTHHNPWLIILKEIASNCLINPFVMKIVYYQLLFNILRAQLGILSTQPIQ
jgi:hypothetical protein